MEAFFRIGVISNTHGLKGEVKVYPTTDDISRYTALKEVILDTGKEHLDLEVEHVKFYKKMVILKFKEFNHIEEVEKYKGKDLLVTRENSVPLKPNEYFIADMLGMRVVTEDGSELGTLADVLETGANDVYVVEMSNKKEVLIPAIKQCILDIDIENRCMKVHLLKGLME